MHTQLGYALTRISFGPKSYKVVPDLQVIRYKLFDVCGDIVQMSLALDEIVSIAERATRLTRRFAHGIVKNYRQQFVGSEACRPPVLDRISPDFWGPLPRSRYPLQPFHLAGGSGLILFD